jgi:hypothetical protein
MILVIFQKKITFQHFFSFHTHMWKFESHLSVIFVKSHEWNSLYGIEMVWLISNIWLSISSSLAIIWIVFKIYFHFELQCYEYCILKTIISFEFYFFWVLNYFIMNTMNFLKNLTWWKFKHIQIWNVEVVGCDNIFCSL